MNASIIVSITKLSLHLKVSKFSGSSLCVGCTIDHRMGVLLLIIYLFIYSFKFWRDQINFHMVITTWTLLLMLFFLNGPFLVSFLGVNCLSLVVNDKIQKHLFSDCFYFFILHTGRLIFFFFFFNALRLQCSVAFMNTFWFLKLPNTWFVIAC